ncbi:MAG: heat-inducible transcription repressor HrcA [Oscillatoriales cyanobacterium SM2_2_1]|nr:heat-inducible transcription repressor HrcA [Oscillatoriales cyanobacterium SM2_2_1]
MQEPLGQRTRKVLWATVERYIITAEPVGSRVLVSEYGFNISAASMRQELNRLDSYGLLYQPHTSAGRVPSDLGYRLYVDELIDPTSELPHTMAHFEGAPTESLGRPLEQLLQGVAQILATLSGCIALISAPSGAALRIQHVQLIPVQGEQFLAIAMGDAYHTASWQVTLPPTDDGELLILNNFLNAHLRDRAWDNLAATMPWEELGLRFSPYRHPMAQVLSQLERSRPAVAWGQIFVSGVAELVRQPEFSDPQQIQTMLDLLEGDRGALRSLMTAATKNLGPTPTVRVSIGNELTLQSMQRCTLIATVYYGESTAAGSVGVLGPTRLDYGRVIASVQAAAYHLTAALRQAGS